MRRKPAVTWARVGFVLALLSIGAYRLSFGALGAVLDTRLLGLLLAGVAIAVSVPGLRRRRQASAARGRRALQLAALAVALVGGGLLVRDLFFCYRAEEVAFSNAGVSLAGTLYLPQSSEGPFPAVVLAHGAGAETRGESAFYARMFARNNIAALAYDKRGSGESGGDWVTATYEDLAADALAAVRYLEGRSEVDKDLIGFKGTSEGGWVVPIAAARAERTAFAILVSTTAESPAEQVRYEVGELVQRAGFDAATAATASELYARLSQFERTGEGREELRADLRRASEEPWFEAANYLPVELPPYEEVERLDWFPAWRRKMDFDAAIHLRQVSCPVLLLLGGKDPKMHSATATASVRDALLEGGNAELTVQVFPEGEHGLVEWFLPGRLPPPRFPIGYPRLMAEWVHGVVEQRR